MKFHHVAISVTDIERSIAFYRDVLDMAQLSELSPFGGEQFDAIMGIRGVQGRMCIVGRETLNLELFEFADSKPKDPDALVSDRGYSHFGVIVDDVDATYERLRAANVRTHCPVISFMGGAVKATYCRDPDGNVFEIIEAKQLPGHSASSQRDPE